MLIVKKPFDTELELDEREKKKEKIIENKEEEEKEVVVPTSYSSEEVHGGEESTNSIQNSSSPSTEVEEEVGDLDSSNNERGEEQAQGEESEEGELREKRGSEESYERSEGEDEDEGESESEGKSEGEDESEDEDEENGGEQMNTYQYNTQQAVDIFYNVDSSTKYYQTEFYRFIEMIAEEKTKIYDYKNAEEYNVKKLMFRQFERKPLSNYRMARARDTVVLILDNSGSMAWWAENLEILAELALERSDVEVYIAPNGHIEGKLTAKGRDAVSHEAFMKATRGRRIIYVGDFDGANTPVLLSQNNDVVWVCPESRYRRFRSHDWVSYSEEDFRGAFLRVYDLDEMFYAIKKLLAHQHVGKAWVDLHEDDEFEDDHHG